MNDIERPATKLVLACVDGGDDGDRALRYAIQEAQRRRTGIRLVHVPLEVIPYAPMSPVYRMPNLREIGARILEDAVERCFELAPGLFVEGSLAHGPRVPAITAESKQAACVVVGTREWHGHRLFGRSTSVGVAAQSVSPVIAVPPSWRPDVPGTNRVVVGVDGEAGPAVVLTQAFEAARLRGAELVIVHAWSAPRPYVPELAWLDPDGWREAASARLLELTAAQRADYADVPTRQVVTYESAPAAVAAATAESDLVVLGRHRESVPLLHLLGSVARHALHAGSAPVEIIPLEPPGPRSQSSPTRTTAAPVTSPFARAARASSTSANP